VNVQFLIRICQRKKISTEKLSEISQRLFNFASGVEKLLFGAPKLNGEPAASKDEENIDEADEEIIKKHCIEGIQSILSASFNYDFTKSMIDHALETLSADESEKLATKHKDFKKIQKLMKKTEDINLRCILGSCALYWFLETLKAFPSSKYQEVLEVCIFLSSLMFVCAVIVRTSKINFTIVNYHIFTKQF